VSDVASIVKGATEVITEGKCTSSDINCTTAKDLTTKVGIILGAATVDLTKGAIEVVIGEQETTYASKSKSMDAIQNLTTTSLESFTEVSGAVSSATNHVVKTASSSAVDVVEHQCVILLD
jgi:hypothetical protein